VIGHRLARLRAAGQRDRHLPTPAGLRLALPGDRHPRRTPGSRTAVLAGGCGIGGLNGYPPCRPPLQCW
jgi:hypothetical protein